MSWKMWPRRARESFGASSRRHETDALERAPHAPLERSELHVEIEKQKLRRRRAPNGEFDRQDDPSANDGLRLCVAAANTLKLRRSRDVFVGTFTPERSREYASAIRTFTSATAFLFEAVIAQRASTGGR